MPHLERLPNELLLLIISEIQNYKNLACFSAQCHRLHALCDLPVRRKYRRIRIRRDGHLNPAFEVLLSILRKPRLATYVRHLEIDREPSESAAYEGKPYRRVIGTYVDQALAVLLITVCPHLESLVLSAPFDVDGRIKPLHGRLVHRLPPALRYLTIRGYKRGQNQYHDRQLSQLLDDYDIDHPSLLEIQGIEDPIPQGEQVFLDWRMIDTPEEELLDHWTDYEY
ncbi:hypothetical protein BJX76DRAFT_358746 [Aspergillus varians]